MAIVERFIQKIENGKVEEYLEYEGKFVALEQRLGCFPAKRFCYAWAGAEAFGTVVWEREWESFAVMEAAYEKAGEDPEHQELLGASSFIVSRRIEYYRTLTVH